MTGPLGTALHTTFLLAITSTWIRWSRTTTRSTSMRRSARQRSLRLPPSSTCWVFWGLHLPYSDRYLPSVAPVHRRRGNHHLQAASLQLPHLLVDVGRAHQVSILPPCASFVLIFPGRTSWVGFLLPSTTIIDFQAPPSLICLISITIGSNLSHRQHGKPTTQKPAPGLAGRPKRGRVASAGR